jgi:adenylate cyclase
MEKKLAILMADLTGYTALTEVHGAAKAAFIIREYLNIVQRSMVGESHLVERVGDQVVLMSPKADDLAATALLMHRNATNISHFLAVHAGIHYGEILQLDGSYYGSAMNLTARLAAKAKGGNILASKAFVDALSNKAMFPYRDYGKVQFKNIKEQIDVVELIHELPAVSLHFDPVCQMQLNSNDLFRSVRFGQQVSYFCSEDCLQIFESSHKDISLAN